MGMNYRLYIACAGLMSWGTMQSLSAMEMKQVTAHLDGTNITYECGQYEPPEDLPLFGDGLNHVDSPLNVVRSQYTQMHDRDWNEFVALWDDFNAPYTQAGVAPPSSAAFVSTWSGVMSNSIHRLRYKILLNGYVMFVVDTQRRDGEFIARSVSTVKQVGKEYRLTRDLTLAENALEQVLDDASFNPMLGGYSTICIRGNVGYSGSKLGSVHVAVVRTASSNSWDATNVKLVSPGAYCVTNVIVGHRYIVKAYLDEDKDGMQSDSDPFGVFPGGTICPTQDVSNVQITLIDRP